MGRNSLRIEIAKKAIERHFSDFDKESLLKDKSLLEMALDAFMTKYNLLEIDKVTINYGFPVFHTNENDILVIPYLDYEMMSPLWPDGRIGDIPLDEIVEKFKWTLSTDMKPGKIIQVRLFSNLGVIKKDTDENFNRKPLHFKNRWFYYNIVEEEVSNDR